MGSTSDSHLTVQENGFSATGVAHYYSLSSLKHWHLKAYSIVIGFPRSVYKEKEKILPPKLGIWVLAITVNF